MITHTDDDQLLADARRYRWLRDRSFPRYRVMQWVYEFDEVHDPYAKGLDFAIDSQIGRQPETTTPQPEGQGDEGKRDA